MISAGLLLFAILPLSYGRPASLPSQQLPTFLRGRDVVGNLVDAVRTMPLTLALNPNNKTGLIDTLMDVSDPSSANYGQHLSKSEVRILSDTAVELLSTIHNSKVNAFVAPSPESVQAITNWLAKYNVTPHSTSPAGDMLHLRVPIATANAMLNANYQALVHEETGATLHKTDSYEIPAAMQSHLAFVHPTTQYALFLLVAKAEQELICLITLVGWYLPSPGFPSAEWLHQRPHRPS